MFRSTDSPAPFADSRRSSLVSRDGRMSTISQTPSTRPLVNAPGTPMSSTFNLLPPSTAGLSPGNDFNDAASAHSLTLNYIPSKFSSTMLSRRRNHESSAPGEHGMVPRGGGVNAFRANASRIPGAHDEDEDHTLGRNNRKLRWTRFKTILFLTNTLFSLYSLFALVFTILTYLRTLDSSAVILEANTTELALSALAASVSLVTALLGWPGILLNNRAFLAVYTALLWVCFGLMVVPGYLTYKKRNLNLDGKINQQWSQALSGHARLVIQNSLNCCGYFSPFVEATVSSTCYARSSLPGCKPAFIDFEKMALERWYIVSFGLVPVHIGVMLAALLCSNHVTYRFGKGMMPKAYRLSREAMAIIVDRYAKQLADQYGPDAAAHMLSASHSGSGSSSPARPGGANDQFLSPHAYNGSSGGGGAGGGDGRDGRGGFARVASDSREELALEEIGGRGDGMGSGGRERGDGGSSSGHGHGQGRF
ncbi:Tetraspanin family-domain-containing protein [Favolaschia claudopus]|uniref:Tetraspanin family-domain-containing protein n=1 Tax=Favolaschia claudopus TaxID=2862362 RepID=A0AAW0CTR6_9AGAR